MTRGIYVIRSAQDLRLLADAAPPSRLALDLPGKPQAEVAARQARLASALGACGCTEGAVGLVSGLVVALIAAVAGWAPGHGALHLGIGALLAASLGCVAGRLVGLMRARRAIRAEIDSALRWIDAD